ncbi:MAG TPA: radical SAM protein [Euryarchaeota archaeon]|nr:radical SAM protein [Euryarchaeota archaeon]
MELVFGPVPSRRLGKSLGVNNIPPKICSYSCVYCQIGSTVVKTIKRRKYFDPNDIYKAVEKRLAEAEEPDYITFVPDGEPTLDINLGREIEALKDFGIKIAVITNGSLLFMEDVREDLSKADLVSVKIDAGYEKTWKFVNRPHEELSFERVIEGIIQFSNEYTGDLITETMLINNVDYSKDLERISEILKTVNPKKAYISIPIRPPAEPWVMPAHEEVINEAYHIFTKSLGEESVELLLGFEGYDFDVSGDIVKLILSITSVHPLRKDILEHMLKEKDASWSIVEKLISEGKIVEVEYFGKKFYLRKIPSIKR